MSQLLDQALGEWTEKLEERKLTVVTTVPEGETWVYADGRHLWRVIDNLLSNCAKYAMEGTRIYVELSRGKGQVTLSVKNVSREALNVPAERLMERFVRGRSPAAARAPAWGCPSPAASPSCRRASSGSLWTGTFLKRKSPCPRQTEHCVSCPKTAAVGYPLTDGGLFVMMDEKI